MIAGYACTGWFRVGLVVVLVATIEGRTVAVASFRGTLKTLPGTMKAEAEHASVRARMMRDMLYLQAEGAGGEQVATQLTRVRCAMAWRVQWPGL